MKYTHGPSLQEIVTDPEEKLTQIQYRYFQTIFREDNTLESNLSFIPSPFLLPNIEESITILNKHIQNNSKILLFGDRDSDGICSTAILGQFLIEKNVSNLVLKSSTEEDYGLCKEALNFVLSEKPNLLITMDFGSTNANEIKILREKGIDVIIFDHHEIPENIPDCYFINPKHPNSEYLEKKICTANLCLKFIIGYLYNEKNRNPHFYLLKNSNSKLIKIIHKGKIIGKGSLEECKSLLLNHQDNQIIELDDDESLCPERKIFFKELVELGIETVYIQHLDLPTIATITDMMPLVGENRILIKEGCKTLLDIKKGLNINRPGLTILLQFLSLNSKKITSKDIGWTIGPAINAAGRMNQADLAVKILTTKDLKEAKENVLKLDKLNEERRNRTERNFFKTDLFLKRKKERLERNIIFCYEPDFEPGVSGIVATRLVREYNKPVVFITPDKGLAKGSIRTCHGENVLNLLHKTKDFLDQYGGHPEAAGFTIQPNKINQFASFLFEQVDDWLIEEKQNLEKIVNAKPSLVSLEPKELSRSIYREIGIFEPFGQENFEPVFSIKNAEIITYQPLKGGRHGKFKILYSSDPIPCIIWNKGRDFESLIQSKSNIDIWGIFEESFYQDKSTIQFNVQYFI